MRECNKEIFYNGFRSFGTHSATHYNISCHKCYDSTKIVTYKKLVSKSFSVEKNDIIQLKYNRKLIFDISCEVPGIVGGSKSIIARHCAVQFDHVAIHYENKLGIRNPVCVACKPGYAPILATQTVDQVEEHFISECVLIEHCRSSRTFNRCDRCEDRFVLKYEPNNSRISQQQQCVPNQVRGCWVGYENRECVQCQQGFVLLQGLCLEADAEECLKMGSLQVYESEAEYL